MAKRNITSDKKIPIPNARLAFPSLWRKASFNGAEGDKYEATLLIPKSDKKTYNAIVSEIKRLQDEAGIKIPKDKWCIRDGDEYDYDGYAGHWAIKASNRVRPTIIDRDKSPLTEDDGVIYGGCYVNAIIQLWLQNNEYGKRINANLLGVQFAKDGEPFSAGVTVSEDEFDEFDEFDELDEFEIDNDL